MKTIDMGGYFSGTSGLVLPYKNKMLYPHEFQERSRLTYYGSLFNSIEINSSFYKVPKAVTVEKWADIVPCGFRFTFTNDMSIMARATAQLRALGGYEL